MDSLRDFGIGLNLNQMFDLVNEKSQPDESHEPPTIVAITPTHGNSHKNEIVQHSVSHKHKEGVFERDCNLSDRTPRTQTRSDQSDAVKHVSLAADDFVVLAVRCVNTPARTEFH